MRLCITSELRLERTPDGAVWTTSAQPYPFWRRYLDIFDEVRVIARVRDTVQAQGHWKRADGLKVHFFGVPYYIGPAAYFRQFRSVQRSTRAAVSEGDALILRVGSNIAAALDPMLRHGRPHGLELVGDPYEVFAPGSVRHPLRPLLRAWFTAQLQRQCRRATAVAYVTEKTLQLRYPPGPNTFTTHYSSVELPEQAFAAAPKPFSHHPDRKVRLISIGSMEQLYKGFDLLLHATAICLRKGLRLELILVGDGRYRPELESLAQSFGIAPVVTFRGILGAGQQVRDELDRADLFVLASKTEGLPRAMIEAMARGLPCLGSAVGGIPELLSPEDLFPRGDTERLADRIHEVVTTPDRMNRMAERNLCKAREYEDIHVNVRRRQFFEVVRRATAEWNRRPLAA